MINKAAGRSAWCPSPWFEIASNVEGRYRLCCWSAPLSYSVFSVSPLEHWNSTEMALIRQAMLAGDRATLRPYCSSCFEKEDSPADSPRLRRIHEMEASSECRQAVEASVAKTAARGDGVADLDYLNRVDLRVWGNLCNLRCVMCCPQSSSSIAVEMRMLGRLPADLQPASLPIVDMEDRHREKFWADIEEILPYTRCFYFAGGEPFLIEAQYEVLERALRLGLSDDLSLWYSTNLTCLNSPSGRRALDLLQCFRKVRLSVSVDGLGERNDYIRYGSRFSRIVENIGSLRSECPHAAIELSTCISMFNVLDLVQIKEYFSPYCAHHSFSNLLTRPAPLQARYLPADLKAQALSRLARDPAIFEVVGPWVGSDVGRGEQELMFELFAAYVAQVDSDRGTAFASVFPELGEYVTALGPQPRHEALVPKAAVERQ